MRQIRLLALLVLSLTLMTAIIAPVESQERVDLIILLDSSRSMFHYYNQVIDFVVSDTVRNYLRFGDGFHLMNFADKAQLEIAQVLRTEEDVRTVVSRLYLMYPLGRNTDLLSALKGVSQYVTGLADSSSKYIILITDGMHSPASDSLYAAYTPEEVRTEMERSAARIRERGWTMRIVHVPFNGKVQTDSMAGQGQLGTPPESGEAPLNLQPHSAEPNITAIQPPSTPGSAASTSSTDSSGYDQPEALSDAPGTGDYLAEIATALGTSVTIFDPDKTESALADVVDILHVAFPVKVKTHDRSFKIKIDIKNPSNRYVPMELEALVLPDGTDILSTKVIADIGPTKSTQLEISVRLPDSIPEGISVISVEPFLANEVRTNPPSGSFVLQLDIPVFATFLRNSASIIIFLGILLSSLAVLVLITLYIRSVHRKAEEPVLQAFLGASETDKASSKHQQTSRLLASSSVTKVVDTKLPAALPVVAHKSSLAEQSPGRSAEIKTAIQTARSVVNLRSSEIPAAAFNDTTPRNLNLLDQWSQVNRKRFVLPLKSTVTKPEHLSLHTSTVYTYTPRLAKPGTLRVELRVRNQNPQIGSRNIKTLHAGRFKTIGGRSSDFLVFLLPFPKRIADIHFDGQNLTIVPIKPAFFPELAGPTEIKLGEELRIVNNRGKELFMHFEHYIPPLEKLNRLMHCIEVPGLTQTMVDIPEIQPPAVENSEL